MSEIKVQEFVLSVEEVLRLQTCIEEEVQVDGWAAKETSLKVQLEKKLL